MKYLKTYEGLFDFFKKKKQEKTTDLVSSKVEDVKDCFMALAGDLNLSVESRVEENKIIIRLVSKVFTQMSPNHMDFLNLEDFIEAFEFTDSYISDLGLKIERYIVYIDGDYDDVTWVEYLYLDDLYQLRRQIDDYPEASKHVYEIEVEIKPI